MRVAIGLPIGSGPALRDVSAAVVLAGGVLHIDQFAGNWVAAR